MNKQIRGYLAILIIVSLVIGALGGALGAFFIKPYLEKTDWGQAFLEMKTDPTLPNIGEKVIKVTEDSATIDVVKKVSPSVVSIVITKELENFYNLTGPDIFDFWNFGVPAPQPQTQGKTKQTIGGGSGFIIGEDGLILTNKHVVVDPDADYTVIFNDGTNYEAQVLGRDVVNDIAILQIDAHDLPVIELGDSDVVEIGQTVIAIGNALGEYRNTVTRGVVSGVNREIEASSGFGSSEELDGVIQTDAAINPGNSGGPLLNLKGQVIGINTAINWQGQSISFAIPINQAKQVIESVLKNGKIVRPWLGVRYLELNKQIAEVNEIKYDYGALVVRGQTSGAVAVVPGSPADKVGLVENDIILEINGQKLDADHSLIKEVNHYSPGDEVELKIFHDGEEKKIKVRLEERGE